MTEQEIRYNLLTLCYRPGITPYEAINTAKVFESYILDKGTATPGETLKHVAVNKTLSKGK